MKIYRSSLFTPTGDPFDDGGEPWRSIPDAYLAVDDDGVIAASGEWSSRPEGGEVIELGAKTLVTPGFVDTHLHAPQIEMIGSYGGHLLEWLERYTFPTEARFADEEHAKRIAGAFYELLLRNGTLTSLAFSTVHEGATRALFREAAERGCRAVIGKVMMDRNAPAVLLETAEESDAATRRLIEEWRDHPMLAYAISPRFAPTSTPELLEVAGGLCRDYPDLRVHTHIGENTAEVSWVRQLFPRASSYTDVYDRYGLLGSRTVLAHAVHMSDVELEILAERDVAIAHCPNSNLFLGSGLFPLQRFVRQGIRIGLGSDIGAGTTPSMFNAMADAYKVQQVRGASLTPFQLWYLATLGGARALSLDQVTGSLEPGKSADFLVLDLEATSLLALRSGRAESIEDLLAGLIFMGDERVVRESYVAGRKLWQRG